MRVVLFFDQSFIDDPDSPNSVTHELSDGSTQAPLAFFGKVSNVLRVTDKDGNHHHYPIGPGGLKYWVKKP